MTRFLGIVLRQFYMVLFIGLILHVLIRINPFYQIITEFTSLIIYVNFTGNEILFSPINRHVFIRVKYVDFNGRYEYFS